MNSLPQEGLYKVYTLVTGCASMDAPAGRRRWREAPGKPLTGLLEEIETVPTLRKHGCVRSVRGSAVKARLLPG